MLVILKEKKWLPIVRIIFPTVRIIMCNDIKTMGKISVDLVLVNLCVLHTIYAVCDKIHSHSILFDSIIRGTLKDHTRYEGKKSH